MSAAGIGGALVVSRRRPVLSVHEVFAGVAELLAELVHHLLEDDRVHVLTEHVEQEPVAHLRLAHDRVDHFAVDEPEADVEQVGAHPRAQDDDEPVEEHERREEAEDEEPEPQEDVDLFVDHVERQDAEGVVLLHLAGRAELVESALGHARENVDHRVDALLLVALGERDHVEAEREERPVEERVHQKHLTCFPREKHKTKTQCILIRFAVSLHLNHPIFMLRRSLKLTFQYIIMHATPGTKLFATAPTKRRQSIQITMTLIGLVYRSPPVEIESRAKTVTSSSPLKSRLGNSLTDRRRPLLAQ